MRFYRVATGCCCLAWISSQAAVTFGPATFSTTDPSFLANISIATSPSEWTLQIPEFLVSDFNSGQVQLLLPVSSTLTLLSIGYEFRGTLLPDATATSTQEVSDGTSLLTLASATRALPANGTSVGTLTLAAPTSDLFIQQTIDLESLSSSGTAQVFEIRYQILTSPAPVPEGSLGWTPWAAMAALLAASYRHSARRDNTSGILRDEPPRPA